MFPHNLQDGMHVIRVSSCIHTIGKHVVATTYCYQQTGIKAHLGV